MISEREARRKRAARKREAGARERRLTEAVALLRDRLGADLGRFIELFDNIAPYQLRELLRDELDRPPEPVETVPSIDEAKIEKMRADWRARPHIGGGFRLDRIK
jgi:hypothetical protein